MTRLLVELFGGPGGWAEGLRQLGMAAVAIELDPAACASRADAGHRTIRADVRHVPVGHLAGRVDGLIASPPCPLFSIAGKGVGRQLMVRLAAFVADVLAGRYATPHLTEMLAHVHDSYVAELAADVRPDEIAEAQRAAWRDVREAALTVEPARWIAATRPRWVALEQVPAVLPLWHVYARQLRAMGYSAWAGILNAADYGVPQTRERAFMIASDSRAVTAPTPTHTRGGSDTLFGTLRPWVTMADALGWDGVLRTGNNTMTTGRTLDDIEWYERPTNQPAPTLDTKAGRTWAWERPATTITGDPRCFHPGGHIANDGRANNRMVGRSEDAIRLTLPEALTLQSFRSDYPVAGSKTKQFEQVGNAVPPLLAAHVIAAITGQASRLQALEATA